VPVFASDVLHVGAFQFGILMTAVGVGSIPGAFVAANMTHARDKGRILVVTTATYMAMVSAFALSPWFTVAFACLAATGVANAIQNTLNSTLLQFNVSDEYRGRVSALYFMTGGLTPFGSLVMGGLIALWGAPAAVAGFALLATALVLALGALSPRLRALAGRSLEALDALGLIFGVLGQRCVLIAGKPCHVLGLGRAQPSAYETVTVGIKRRTPVKLARRTVGFGPYCEAARSR
jgi:MFS family permease